MSLAGSRSIALTTMVPPLPAVCATASLMAEGNPAPPSPGASSADRNASRIPRGTRRRERREAQRRHVIREVSRVTQNPKRQLVGMASLTLDPLEQPRCWETPLQMELSEMSWLPGERNLIYQSIDAPELAEKWIAVRKRSRQT